MHCFKVYSNEIEGRLDPYFFSQSTDNEIYTNKKYFIDFGDIGIEIRKGIFNLNSSEYTEKGIPFIRISNIIDAGIDFSSMVYITEESNNKEQRTQLKPGDLVFAKIGTIDRVGLLPNNCLMYNMSQNIIGAKLSQLQNKNYNPEFIRYFFQLDIAKRQLLKEATFNVQPKLTLDALRKIKFPKLSLNVQNKIVLLMQAAYENKKQKEQESERLLNSIDDFVLERLGIIMPEIKEKKCFSLMVNEIENRLDPLFYSQEILNFIRHSKNKTMTIGEISEYLKAGFAAGKSNQNEIEEGIIQIRPTNIDNDRQLVFDKNIYIKQEEKLTKKQYLLKRGEVLFNNTNSQELVGKTTLFDLKNDYFCSNHITRIKVYENLVNPGFLALILNLYQRNKVFFNTCTNWNNQSGVNIELLASFSVPVPDIKNQNLITKAVEERIIKAIRLKNEAQKELEQAKVRVEKIILGEESIEG